MGVEPDSDSVVEPPFKNELDRIFFELSDPDAACLYPATRDITQWPALRQLRAFYLAQEMGYYPEIEKRRDKTILLIYTDKDLSNYWKALEQ